MSVQVHDKKNVVRRGWLTHFLAWFREVPRLDAVDRRNAILLQCMIIVSLVYAVPVSWVRLGGSFRDHPFAETLVVLNCLVMLACFFLLRRGATVGTVRLFVASCIVALFTCYMSVGLSVQTAPQLTPLLMPLVISALMLSRRSLWLVTSVLICTVLCGAWRDSTLASLGGVPPAELIWLAMRIVFALLLVALVLDFSVESMRNSLRMARERGDALQRARDELQLEMQEKERTREQLLHSQRVDTAGRLASGIAHDFNHLLGLILAYTARRHHCADVEELQLALQGVDSAARRAVVVSRKLLDFVRNDDNCPEWLELSRELSAMRPMLRQLFAPEVTVELDLADTVAWVWFDRAQLELIVLSVAANANDAMPAGGCFRLTLRCFRAMAELEVSDTGMGMSADVLQRCLKPFFTTKPRGQGSGLGLSTADTLVRAVGGSLQVESELGVGTMLRIRLPACGSEPVGARVNFSL